jgi:hypothetical protein
MDEMDNPFDLICDCGHDNRQHGQGLASPWLTRPCSLEDCDCTDFRPVGQGDDAA